MGSADVIVWACGLVGLICGAPAKPDLAALQSAYEGEAAKGSKLHDIGLKIITATCDDPMGGRTLCQVSFISRQDPQQQLYFDVVAVARDGSDWRLESGLCKH